MGLFSFLKRRKGPPDRKTLGRWLWNNDVSLLDRTLTGMLVNLMETLDEDGIVRRAAGNRFAEEQRDWIAGDVMNRLDGNALVLKSHKPLTPEMTMVAQEVYDQIIARGKDSAIFGVAMTAGTLLAVRAWYAQDYAGTRAVATHMVTLLPENAEAYRVRGFSHFAEGNYSAALADLEQAYKMEPGLNGLFEPLQAARELMGHATEPESKRPQSVGIRDLSAALKTIYEALNQSRVFVSDETEAKMWRVYGLQCLDLSESVNDWGSTLSTNDVASFVECSEAGLRFADEHLVGLKPWPGSPFPPKEKIISALSQLAMSVMMFASMNPGVFSNEVVAALPSRIERVIGGLGEPPRGGLGAVP